MMIDVLLKHPILTNVTSLSLPLARVVVISLNDKVWTIHGKLLLWLGCFVLFQVWITKPDIKNTL